MLINILVLFIVVFLVYNIINFILFLTGKEFNFTFFLKYLLVSSFVLAMLSFISFILFSGKEYYEQIDPFFDTYTPFARKHRLTLITYLILYNISAYLLQFKQEKLTPLLKVLALVFNVYGIILSIFIFFQTSVSKEENYSIEGEISLYALCSIIFIASSVILIIKTLKKETILSNERNYKNKILNYLNIKIAESGHLSLWVLIMLLPVYVMITCILILFGQDSDSVIKVFTETTTWNFSEMNHPPYLDLHGHYLCTVSACGSPLLVKPLYFGHRNGHPIIVNRQLQIANAFEEMISELSPVFHRFFRELYDKYGFDIAKKIDSKLLSNITYLMMKPLEYFFLFCLYLLIKEPEKLIKKQYR